MKAMDIVVLVCDRNLWAVDPFLYCFRKYWRGERILLAGFSEPANAWSDVDFYSIGRQEDYPIGRWSDALMALLDRGPIGQHFILLLEDYWLCRPTDTLGIQHLAAFMEGHDDVLRLDLVTDRLYTVGIEDIGAVGHLDLIDSDIRQPYSVSLQASIWNKTLLRRLLLPGESPWEFELSGSRRLPAHGQMRVIGTRQGPLRYVIGIRGGRASLDGSWQGPPKQFCAEDLKMLEPMLP